MTCGDHIHIWYQPTDPRSYGRFGWLGQDIRARNLELEGAGQLAPPLAAPLLAQGRNHQIS